MKSRMVFRTVIMIWLAITMISGTARTAGGMTQTNPQYTKGFSIEYYANGIKKIRDNDGRFFWLVPYGQTVPPNFPLPKVIRIPLKKALFTSVTQACLLRPFADPVVWKSVAGVATPAEQWYLPEVRSGLQKGRITYIGDAYSPDYELVQQLQPDVTFLYTGSSGLTEFGRKLDELHLPYLAENSYLETDPIGRLEWIKFYAAFYNQEALAEQYFQRAVARIGTIKKRISAVNRPKIAWGVIYNGKVYIPGANSFVARMIELAGGINVFKKLSSGKGSVAVTLEHFLAGSRDADLLIYASFPQYMPSIEGIVRIAPVLSEINPVKTRKVWVLQPWYNQQQDRTDGVIADLAAIFHPKRFSGVPIKNFLKLK